MGKKSPFGDTCRVPGCGRPRCKYYGICGRCYAQPAVRKTYRPARVYEPGELCVLGCGAARKKLADPRYRLCKRHHKDPVLRAEHCPDLKAEGWGEVPTCKHCGKKGVNRPRGLCWSCYYTPGVLEQYPSTSKHAYRSPVPAHSDGPLPAEIMPAGISFEDRLKVLEGRAARGESLFHPADDGGLRPKVLPRLGGLCDGLRTPNLSAHKARAG